MPPFLNLNPGWSILELPERWEAPRSWYSSSFSGGFAQLPLRQCPPEGEEFANLVEGFLKVSGDGTQRSGCIANIPSGKRLHNYGKSPCSMGKSTINGHFQ